MYLRTCAYMYFLMPQRRVEVLQKDLLRISLGHDLVHPLHLSDTMNFW